VLDEVRTVLRRQTVLFLGYNLADPDFNLLWREVLDRAGRFARTAYAVWPGLPEADVRMWRDRDIVILEAEPFGILGKAVARPIPEVRSETTIPVNASSSLAGGQDVNYERGLQVLESFAKPEDEDAWRDLKLYKGQLLENLSKERRYGTTETLRNERFQIVDKLNPMALRLTGLSFTDLCLGKQPAPETRLTPDDHEIIERLRRIEAKLVQGRAEDRQAAHQILDALAHDRVEQAEITQMVTELRSWAQIVQQAGLPLNPELREALDALSEHKASAYQYLQLALPIIPGILSYNIELGGEHQLDLKFLWNRLKARVGGEDAKGDGSASTSVEQVLNTGKAWAVLVGINRYEDPYIANLKVCVDDVTAIHQSLDASYQVAKLLTDATPERLPIRANILGELSAIAQSASEGDLLLFYFSGHGIAEGGESYLLARDTRLSALKHTAVSMHCLASCKQGQKSWQWPEKDRSVFTYYLLEALSGRADLEGKKGFVTVSDTSQYVTNGVKSWAAVNGVPQTPTLQYTVAGDIILVRYQ